MTQHITSHSSEQGQGIIVTAWKRDEFRAPDVIFNADDLRANDKLVYLCLCRHADGEAKAFPSYNTIARECSISRRTAIDTIKQLIEKGLLEKSQRTTPKGDATSNIYILYHPARRYPQGGVVQEMHHLVQQMHHVVQDVHHQDEGIELKYKNINNNNRECDTVAFEVAAAMDQPPASPAVVVEDGNEEEVHQAGDPPGECLSTVRQKPAPAARGDDAAVLLAHYRELTGLDDMRPSLATKLCKAYGLDSVLRQLEVVVKYARSHRGKPIPLLQTALSEGGWSDAGNLQTQKSTEETEVERTQRLLAQYEAIPPPSPEHIAGALAEAARALGIQRRRTG